MNFGDRFFNVKSSNARLPQPEADQLTLRWAAMSPTTSGLITPGASVSLATTVVVQSVSKLITLSKLFFQVTFFDSSAGTTYRLGKGQIYPRLVANLGSDGQLVIPIESVQGSDLGIKMNLDDNNGAAFTMDINGGDILNETGITPGAGDQVTFKLSFSYY